MFSMDLLSDLWFLYKPPTGNLPFLHYGSNFSYISADSVGRWMPSKRSISSNSMLINTLAPIFRATYSDILAFAQYDDRKPGDGHPGSTARGVFMADQMGGVWIIHNLPAFPDITKDRASFPDTELENGHLIACLSLSVKTLNAIGDSIKKVDPIFRAINVPQGMEPLVSHWRFFPRRALKMSERSTSPSQVSFKTRGKSLSAHLMTRQPGSDQDLIYDFACSQKVIMDVYDQSKLPARCTRKCGVRNFGPISLKFSESIVYVGNKTDTSRFSVSTALHWQQKGQRGNQFLVCISTLDRQDNTHRAGTLLCFSHYLLWLSFANMKGKEPKC